ncbi:RsmB/NOP family class I SAM-dependent RNA methyltransferase [Alphaproteobacteria bacterium]|nr:RsmB/NOP family class I SAM-dependent RNA methyltransferase [Alphaproteobacteria bacterium]
MKKSVKIRKLIYEIIYDIYQKNLNFDESYYSFTKNTTINEIDRSMIFSVVLNSMRNNIYITSTLNQYLKKRTSRKIKILLLSAITQILYLNFKDYAVTNDTVEVAKIKKLNPGLVNSLLKNLIKNRVKINKKKINLKIIPEFIKVDLKDKNIGVDKFFETIAKEPSLHLVFKNKKLLDHFEEENIRTTETSAFLTERKKIPEIYDYNKGSWWVQDFASMLPIYLCSEFNSKKIIDMCSAPGGKAFQNLSLGNDTTLVDVSKKRIEILKKNLNRLKFKCKILNSNALNISENEYFDVVVLDSPCSGLGTVRRNPEIFFKKAPPNIEKLNEIQSNLINKASKLVKKNGVLLYMVCSFLLKETKNIKENFLKNNKHFSQLKFIIDNQSDLYQFIDEEGDINCMPSEFKGFMVDGFYAVKFIKNA